MTLSDIIEGYKRVMKKHGFENDTMYYALMVKLSLSQ